MAGANTLAEAIVSIRADDRALMASLSMIRGKLGAFSGAALTLFGTAIRGASHLTETMNKLNVVFGSSAWVVTESAGKMATEFGIVKQDFMDMSATFGQVLQSMGGMTEDASANMSSNMAKAAADMSSLWKKPFNEVSSAIASALRGMSRPIAQFGIDTQLAAVKQEAFRMGLVKTNRDLTTQEKVIARASLIMKGLGVAQGDLAATSGSFANANRAVWGRISNAITDFGMAIIPVAERFMAGLNAMLSGLNSWVTNNKSLFTTWSEKVADAFMYGKWAVGEVAVAVVAGFARMNEGINLIFGTNDALGDSWQWLKDFATEVFDAIGFIFIHWSSIMEMAGTWVMEKVLQIGDLFNWLMGVASTFGEWFGNNWINMIVDGANSMIAIITNMWQNVKDLFAAGWAYMNGEGWNFKPTGLLDGFKAVTEALPEIAAPALTDLSKDFERIMEKMGADEAAVVQRRIDATKKADAVQGPMGPRRKPGVPLEGDEGPEKGKKDKAETTDLQGFAKNLQEGMFGKNQAAERTAKNTESIASTMNRIEANQRKKQPAAAALAAGPA